MIADCPGKLTRGARMRQYLELEQTSGNKGSVEEKGRRD